MLAITRDIKTQLEPFDEKVEQSSQLTNEIHLRCDHFNCRVYTCIQVAVRVTITSAAATILLLLQLLL